MSEDLLTPAAARKLVLAEVEPLGAETVALQDALGRVLAEDVVAGADVPPFAASAMDGYAVIAGAAGRRLRVNGESRAGHPATAPLRDGEAIRISTGAAVPAGADAVVPVEQADESGDAVVPRRDIAPGANVRSAGEDMRSGAAVLTRGRALGAAELAVAAGAGRAELSCARRPRVVLLATGDELVAPGQPLGPGQIHESNGLALAALAARAGAEVVRAARVPDDRAATATALEPELEAADVLAISGGVSVGEHDHVKAALERLGVQRRFWGVALKPGKPVYFGTRDGCLVFGLPGNPVSAVVCFVLFAHPALRALQGADPSASRFHARLAEPVRCGPREQALRVGLEFRADGIVARTTGAQESHRSTSLLGADALAFVPPGEGELAAGTEVLVEPLDLGGGRPVPQGV